MTSHAQHHPVERQCVWCGLRYALRENFWVRENDFFFYLFGTGFLFLWYFFCFLYWEEEENLELGESLVSLALRGANTEHVESDSLAQRSALSNGNLVTLLNTESWGDVSRQVAVPLLVTVVLWDVVEVIPSDDDGTVHLGGDDSSGEDTATDGDETGEWALFVDVGSLNGGLWGLEAQTNVLVPPPSTLSDPTLRWAGLAGEEDVGLLLESTLRLHGEFGGHFVDGVRWLWWWCW